jgi:hypothetical protein
MSGRKRTLLLAVVSALSLTVYLIASQLTTGAGFPLDDAWIHQTYARNLAQGYGWSLIPGEPSAGLTAPLWALLLAPATLLHLGPFQLTFLLGWASLWGLSLTAAKLTDVLLPGQPRWSLAVGLLMALEWHLVWAAGSGMETLLFTLLVTYILSLLVLQEEMTNKNSLLIGALVGLSAWLRPEGITLLAAVGLVWLCRDRKFKSGAFTLAGFALAFLPYLAFNRWLAGAGWPNTFYAKQAEYISLLELPLFSRLIGQFSLPLVGAGALLLPGYIYSVYKAIKNHSWGILAGILWMLGFLGMYALRLPVTYQHGRYAIPAMPVYFIFSLIGTAKLAVPQSKQMLQRLVSRAWLVSLAVVCLLFYGMGARAYTRDVAIINTEMVAIAQWITEYTSPNELIAAHDIGALGFFGNRPLLDLAGLVSPDVIPFIRDEERLADYLDQQQPVYLVTFPGWYPLLTARAELVYSTNAAFSPESGGENMAVYRWKYP